jgi:hypothetical protein
VSGAFSITPLPGTYFWSNGYAWGNAVVGKGAKGSATVKILVASGSLGLKSVGVTGKTAQAVQEQVTLKEGESKEFSLPAD